MDIITGFPGETEAEFAWGVERLRELPWTRLHVFPYSERAGTPATRLPGSVPHEERRRRARALSELSFERLQAHHEKLLRAGPLEGILLERSPKGPAGLSLSGPSLWDGVEYWAAGYTSNYLRVFTPVPSPDAFRNQLVRVRPERLSVDRVNNDVAFVGSLA
jgi:threonylcarbamoyladenosine tRNA methylthiotransferase MtaB